MADTSLPLTRTVTLFSIWISTARLAGRRDRDVAEEIAGGVHDGASSIRSHKIILTRTTVALYRPTSNQIVVTVLCASRRAACPITRHSMTP